MSVTPPKSGPSAAVIVVIASAALVVLVGALVAVTFALLPTSSPASVTEEADEEEPTRTEITLDAFWGDGSALSDDEMESTEDVIVARLDRAGIEDYDFSVVDEQIRITFDDDTDEDVIDEAALLLDLEFRLDFRPVLDVGVCGSGNDYTDYGPDKEVIFCDRAGETAIALGPSEFTGDTIVGSTTYELSTGTGWGVTMVLDSEGTAALASLTKRLLGAEGVLDRLGITLGGEVLESPEVVAAIENGKVSISGNMDEEQAEALAAELRLASKGLTLTLASVTLAD